MNSACKLRNCGGLTSVSPKSQVSLSRDGEDEGSVNVHHEKGPQMLGMVVPSNCVKAYTRCVVIHITGRSGAKEVAVYDIGTFQRSNWSVGELTKTVERALPERDRSSLASERNVEVGHGGKRRHRTHITTVSLLTCTVPVNQ